MKANEFLTKVVESLGLVAGVEGEVMVMVPGDEEGEYISNPVVSKSGYPFLLPTNKNLNRLIKVGDGGKVSLEYLPYCPIIEDDVGNETQAFKSYIKRAQVALSLDTFETGSLLLEVAKNDKAISSKGVRVERFLTSLGKHITSKNMKIVDDTTLKTFMEMIKNCKEPGNKKLLHITVKRRGNIDGHIYPVVTSIHFPLMESIYKLDSSEEGYVNDVKLRKKDIVVFKELFKALFPMVGEDFIYRVHSSREDYPMFDSSYRLYLDLMVKHKEILSKLSDMMDEGVDPTATQVSLKSNEIDGILTSIAKELSRIPTERSLIGQEYTPAPKQQVEEIQQVNLPTRPQPVYQGHQPVPQHNQVPQQPAMGQPLVPIDPYGNPIGPVPSGYQHAQGYHMTTPQLVSNSGYMGNAANTIASAFSPYPQTGVPYNALSNSGYGNYTHPYVVGTEYSPYGNQPSMKLPMGLTGGSDF